MYIFGTLIFPRVFMCLARKKTVIGMNGAHISRYHDSFDFQKRSIFSWGLIFLVLTKLFVEQQITCFNWTIEH